MALISGSVSALNAVLNRVNEARRNAAIAPEEALVRDLFETETQFALVGATAPPQFENMFLARFAGKWGQGAIRGVKMKDSWSAPFVSAGVRWDPSGDEMVAQVLRAPGLRPTWAMMDAAMMMTAARTLAPCILAGGEICVVNIYEPRGQGDPGVWLIQPSGESP